MSRKKVLVRSAIALSVVACSAMSSCFLFPEQPAVNLLVISVDGLRSDALRSAIGSARTPNMQRIEGVGVGFTSCFGASSAVLPAQAALLSGRTPSHSRVRSGGQVVGGDVPLLQTILQSSGWQTFADFSSPSMRPAAKSKGLDRGFHLCRTHDSDAPSAAEVNTRVIPFLERATPDIPWFAFVEYSDPTAPYDAHGSVDRSAQVVVDGHVLDAVRTSDASDWTRNVHLAHGKHVIEMRSPDDLVVERFGCVANGEELDATIEKGALGEPGKSFVVSLDVAAKAADVDLSAFVHDVPDLAETRARYKLEVEAVDRAIGDLITTLEKNGQYDHTCIVLVAPHGEALGEHGLVGHDSNLYDEVLRVPLVIKPALNEPKRAQLGKHRLDPVRVIDIAPTLLDLVGADQLDGAEGQSLLRDADRTLTAEVHAPDAPGTYVAMRDDHYKLIYVAREDRFEMYDAKSDTLELDNVFALQGHFRQEWQTKLRDLAENAAHTADLKAGRVVQAETRALH